MQVVLKADFFLSIGESHVVETQQHTEDALKKCVGKVGELWAQHFREASRRAITDTAEPNSRKDF